MNEGAYTLLLSPLTLGPRSLRRGHDGKARRVARTMRASSLHAQGCAFNEPRHGLANRSEAAARRSGGVSLVTFFAQALRRRSGANSGAGREAAKGRMPEVKKVTRSSAGRVEALDLLDRRMPRTKLDYKLHPQFASRAIRYANVRFGVLPSQSGLRGNDEQGQKRPLPALRATFPRFAGEAKSAGAYT